MANVVEEYSVALLHLYFIWRSEQAWPLFERCAPKELTSGFEKIGLDDD